MIIALISPLISHVTPQVVTAGTPGLNITVQGSNFQTQSALTVNGVAVPTTVVNSTTLAAQISPSTLAQPNVAQLQVRNTDGAQSNQVALTVTTPPQSPSSLTVSTTTIPGAQAGTAYSATLTAGGGTPGYTWAITAGALPAGLTLSNTGVLSGTPTASGTFSFTATVSDSGSPVQQQTVTLSLVVTPVTTAPPTLTINSGALASGKTGTAYSATLGASGGTPGYTWTLTGSLPQGLKLAANGVISGTPTATGTASFTVTVTDSGSPAQTASATESITISATAPVLTVNSGALGSGTSGTPYTATLGATGGTLGYTWAVTSGNLPQGLTLAANGVISGTPTGSGTASFTVTVTDSGSPAQTASATESISIATPTLAITTTTLASGTVGTNYSASLSATGGTPTHNWSIASGNFPAGLTLSSLGAISGTPTTPGTFSFTVEVSDTSSPIKTATATESITIAPAQLKITSTTLGSGQTSLFYTTTLGATGGTLNYTWSITSGNPPAGLSLSAGGVLSGTPTGTGTSSFTVTVKDSGSPAQSASLVLSLTINPAPTGPGTTWYVRPDGGTRYSTNMPQGQCDGKGDQSYAAALAANGGVATPNLHCAFADIRSMYGDGSYNDGVDFPGFGWVMQGGDTLIIRGSVSTGVTYRVGWDNIGNSYNCSGANPITGICGNPFNSFIPPPPNGSATQPTRILGENYQNCSAQGARTSLRGGASVFDVLNLSGASYIDVECLDISDFSQCDQCTVNDDKSTNGIQLSNKTTNTTITNVRLHGLAYNGLYGPTGDGVVMDHIDIVGNGSSGWEADDGSAGTGHTSMSHFTIMWNGCSEEYPIVDTLPYMNCRDDNSGGYGDGFGSATIDSPAPGYQVHFDQGIVAYNTQDGLDGLHMQGPGTGMTVTRVLAYGNMGQQIKIGGLPVIQNSVIVGNCTAMQNAIPGTPANYNQYLTDFCRAGDTTVVLMSGPTNPIVYQYNTMLTNNLVGLEIEYLSGSGTGTETIQYNNNISFGFVEGNPRNQNPSLFYSNSDLNMFTNPGASYSNNDTYGNKAGYPCPPTGDVNSTCADPGLVDETWHNYGYGDMSPLSTGNAVVGAGIALSGVTVDYTGQTRGNPPTIGAYESTH